MDEVRTRPSLNIDKTMIDISRQLIPCIICGCIIFRDNTIDNVNVTPQNFCQPVPQVSQHVLFDPGGDLRPVHAHMAMSHIQPVADNPYGCNGRQYGLPLVYQAQILYHEQ